MDIKGNILASDYTNDSLKLKPGSKQNFKLSHKANPKYERMRIYVSKVNH